MFGQLLPTVTGDIARLAAVNAAVGEALLPRLCSLVRTLDSLNAAGVAAALSGASLDVEEAKVVDPDADVVVVNGKAQPANYRHAVIESEHPYLPAVSQSWDLEFAADVAWLVVEFDAKCVTAQSEDRVSLYFDADLRQKVGNDYFGTKGEDGSWPTGPIVVPGHRLTVVFQTATDYGNRPEDAKFGLRAVVTAHKPVAALGGPGSGVAGPLLSLECELSFALGVCLSQALCAGATADNRKQAEKKEDAEGKDGKGKGKKGKGKGKKKAVGAAGAGSGKWVTVPDAEFDPDWSSGVTFSEDNLFLHANTNGHAVLNYGISAGKIAYEVTIVKETHSQCTCLGVAIKDGLEGVTGTSYNHRCLWMYRCFNAYKYTKGVESSTTNRKIFQGDRVRVELDMDEGTVSYTINEEEVGVVFENLNEEEEVFPAINFYSGDRELRLELVEVSGAAIAQCGLSAGVAGAAGEEALAAPIVVDTVVPPTVFSAIEGGMFEGGLRCEDPTVTTGSVDSHAAEKRAFLDDLIAGDAATAGGRLSDWLTRVVDQEHATALLARRLTTGEWVSALPILGTVAAPNTPVFDASFDAGGADKAASVMAGALSVAAPGAAAGGAGAAEKPKPKFMPVPFCSAHEHFLEHEVEPRKSGARCDLCRTTGSCLYVCESCDFDICGGCYEPAKITGASFTTFHEHPINLKPEPERAFGRVCNVCSADSDLSPVYCCDIW